MRDIIVTAERRTNTVQRTAASLSVRSGEELLEQGRYQLKNILETVPGITGGAADNSGASSGSGTDNPASGLVIRGVPSNVGAGGSITSTASAAAIYADDIYNGIGSAYDIDRVEVLRGPQGTLYGRSATSGVVSIHTRDPDLSEVKADLSGEIGNYQVRHYTGGISIPIVKDVLALRVSGNYYKQGGYYFDNMGGGRINKDFRAKLLFKPTDNFMALFGFALERNKTYSGGVLIYQETPAGISSTCGNGTPTPNSLCIAPDTVTPGTNSANQYWGEFNLDLGSFGITYIPAYRTWKQDFVSDTRNSVTLPFYQTSVTPSDWFHTEELRFHSNSDSRLQWQAGGMYYLNKLHDINTLNVYGGGVPIFLAFNTESFKTTLSLGAFAEGTYALTPETRVTGGLRYDYTKVRNDQTYSTSAPPNTSVISKSISGDAATRRFRSVTYKARVEHDLAPANMIYASVSTGVSPGDVLITTSSVDYQPRVQTLEAETLTAFEIGSKNRFLGGRLQLNAAVFYNNYGGYQVANVNEGSSQNPAFKVILAKLRAYGFELDAIAQPWTNGRFSYNMSYTNSTLHDIPSADQPYFAHSQVPGIPPFQATMAYDHNVPLHGRSALSLHGELRFISSYDIARILVSDVNLGADAYNRTGDQFIGNLSATLSLANGALSITGYVRNVADNRYKNSSGFSVLSSGAISVTGGQYDPRTFGGIVSVKF